MTLKTPFSPQSEPIMENDSLNPYKGIADLCGLSDITIRKAFARKPITYQTACRIANRIKIPVECFRIKADTRGMKKR